MSGEINKWKEAFQETDKNLKQILQEKLWD